MTAFIVWLILQQPVSRPATETELSGVGHINPEWKILTVPAHIYINKAEWVCRETEKEYVCDPRRKKGATP